MWTSVALTVSLLSVAPAANDKLKISHARLLYQFQPWHVLGLVRPDNKFLPGDIVGIAYDIENASMDKKTGKVVYSLALELFDSKGKRIYRRANQQIEALNVLNSRRQPSFGVAPIGIDTEPGKYKLKITARDKITDQKAELTQDFEVLKKKFGFIRVYAPTAIFVGTPFELNFTVVGFQKDTRKYPKVTIKVDFIDEKGAYTLVKPIKVEIPKDLGEGAKPEEISAIPMPLQFLPNRAGKFTIKVKATDHIGKKPTVIEFEYKVTILDPKKFESGK
jgi:hypothetical protein